MKLESKYEVLTLSAKLAEENQKFDKEKKLASRILKALVEDKKEKVFLRFILTMNNRDRMSENLFKVLRIANYMLENEKGYFYKKLKEETGKEFMLKQTLPKVKNVPDAEIDMIRGFTEDIKMHEISLVLVEKIDFENAKTGLVSISAKEDSKSAGKVASRVLRTLVVDEDVALLRYVRTKRNALAISEKAFSAQKILYRMSKEPASEINSKLPTERIGYEIGVYGPFVRKEKLETKNLKDDEQTVLTHKIYFTIN